MEKNESISEHSTSQAVPSRLRWKLGLTGLVLVGGLVLLVIGVFAGSVEWNRRTVNWFLFRFDPRYWSLSIAPVLWGIVCWLVTDIACRLNWIHRKQIWIRLVIMLSVLYGVLHCFDLTGRKITEYIYYQVYMDYIVGPAAGYMATGTFSWKIFIAPALAVVTITILLYIAVKQRRKKL